MGHALKTSRFGPPMAWSWARVFGTVRVLEVGCACLVIWNCLFRPLFPEHGPSARAHILPLEPQYAEPRLRHPTIATPPMGFTTMALSCAGDGLHPFTRSIISCIATVNSSHLSAWSSLAVQTTSTPKWQVRNSRSRSLRKGRSRSSL